MRIKMLETRDGADDGFTVKSYEKDNEYTVSDDLGNSFVGAGVAMPVKEERAIAGAPENKAIGAAPEDKSRGRARSK